MHEQLSACAEIRRPVIAGNPSVGNFQPWSKRSNVRIGSNCDIGGRQPEVRFTPKSRHSRRRFLVALGHAIHLTWPVLSAILAIQLALGLLIGFVEGWSLGDAVYFTFITGLTIGYGDLVPRQTLTRALAIGIAFFGLLVTGVIAAIAVHAIRSGSPMAGVAVSDLNIDEVIE